MYFAPALPWPLAIIAQALPVIARVPTSISGKRNLRISIPLPSDFGRVQCAAYWRSAQVGGAAVCVTVLVEAIVQDTSSRAP